MPELKDAYLQLRLQIINNIGDDDVNDVKENFSEVVESRRSLDRAVTFPELLELLEQQNVICEDNVMMLKYLLKLLRREDIIEIIATYEKLFQLKGECVICKREQTEPIITLISRGAVPSAPSQDLGYSELEKAIMYVSQEISRQWPKLVRILEVKEGDIEDVEQLYRGLQEKAYHGLRRWLERGGRNANIGDLKTALRSHFIHRNDLADNLDNGEHLKL